MRRITGAPSVSCTSADWGFQDQTASVGILHHLAIAALDLPAGVISFRPAILGGLHTLAVEHRGCGRALSSDLLAIGHDQQMVDGLEQSGIAPQAEPA